MSSRRPPFVRRLHLEGIPWPGTALYNVLSRSRVFLRHYELVADEVAQYVTPARLLDVGTGPGRLLLALRKRLPEAQLVGIDVSAAMVAQARRNVASCRGGSRIEIRAADAAALPFADGTFDCVVSTGSLHHWKDSGRALSEMHRVLRVEGRALLYDLVRDMPNTVIQDARTEFGGFRIAMLWLHSFEEPFLDAREMEELGRQTDFVVERVKFTGALCCLVLRKTPPPDPCWRGHHIGTLSSRSCL